MLLLDQGHNWTFEKCLKISDACRDKAANLQDDHADAEKAGRPARELADLEARKEYMHRLASFWRCKADRHKKGPECGNTRGDYGKNQEQADYSPAA